MQLIIISPAPELNIDYIALAETTSQAYYNREYRLLTIYTI